MAENGRLAVIQQLVGSEGQSNPEQRLLNIVAISQSLGKTHLDAEILNFDKTDKLIQARVSYHEIFNQSWIGDGATHWLYTQLGKYFTDSFFFNPFRHSTAVMGISHTDALAQDGSNLVQVLNTLKTNDEETFDAIDEFIHDALPDMGRLTTPSIPGTNTTKIEFRVSRELAATPLTYMGGGVEQLLMAATVLLMPKTQHHTIFLEEPESHLHAGAQRFLMEKLRDMDRQVFITTHSPTFINAVEPFSIYLVINSVRRTSIKKCDARTLDEVLEEIGVRNSDVLQSDAVVFIEGQSDSDVLSILSEKLNMSLAKRNINVLLMHGGRYAHRTATLRSELLEDISQKAPVPHMFLLDRDERAEKEIFNLENKLQGKVHFLKSRELENYLLVPHAILQALKAKYIDNPPMLKKINSTTEDQVAKVISETANSLYGTVFFKRVRSEIGGLRDSLLPTSALSILLQHIKSPDLPEVVMQEIKSEFGQYISDLALETIVTKQGQELDKLWADPKNHVCLAPGEEILEAVFKIVGSRYIKTEDAARIAREMQPLDISQEIKGVIEQAFLLTS
jgi:hypothetical protein